MEVLPERGGRRPRREAEARSARARPFRQVGFGRPFGDGRVLADGAAGQSDGLQQAGEWSTGAYGPTALVGHKDRQRRGRGVEPGDQCGQGRVGWDQPRHQCPQAQADSDTQQYEGIIQVASRGMDAAASVAWPTDSIPLENRSGSAMRAMRRGHATVNSAPIRGQDQLPGNGVAGGEVGGVNRIRALAKVRVVITGTGTVV